MSIIKYGKAGVLIAMVTFGAFVDCSSETKTARQLAASCQLNSDCDDPLACGLGRCHQQCVESRDCPNPQRCVKGETAGVCQLKDEASCVRDSECKEPLTCATDSQCRNACVTDRDCVTKQICAVGGFCADLTEVTKDGHLIGGDPGDSGAGGRAGSGGKTGTGGGAGSGGKTGTGGTTGSGGTSDSGGTLGAGGSGATPDASTSVDGGEPTSDAGPPGAKLYVRSSTALLVYTLDQLTADNTGPTPLHQLTNFYQVRSQVDLDGNVWGDGDAYVGGLRRFLGADLAKSGGLPAAGQMKQFSRPAGGQRAGVDALGNVWVATMAACPGCPVAYTLAVTRLDRASVSAAAVAGEVVGATSTLSVGYTTTNYNNAPTGIWFDGEGTLVLSEADAIKRYVAADLTGTGAHNDPPTTKLTVTGTALPGVETAVASSGDFWFLCGAPKALCRHSKAALVAGGTATTPTGTLTVTNLIPVGLAFDSDDNLWAISTSKLVRLPKADLEPTGNVTSTPVVRINPPSGFGSLFSELFIAR